LHVTYRVGTPETFTYAAQWLACTIPCRRFTGTLTDDGARLGANSDRYSFIAADSHRLLLAGLPAHRSLKRGELVADARHLQLILLRFPAFLVREPVQILQRLFDGWCHTVLPILLWPQASPDDRSDASRLRPRLLPRPDILVRPFAKVSGNLES
jgi:hypothetical protein